MIINDSSFHPNIITTQGNERIQKNIILLHIRVESQPQNVKYYNFIHAHNFENSSGSNHVNV